MNISEPATDAYDRGLAHLRRAEYEAAESAFTETIRLNPEAPKAYLGRALARRSRDDDAGALADEQMVRELGGLKTARSEFLVLLTPDFDLCQRVDQQPFVEYVGAVDSATKRFFEQYPHGLELQVACAVLPQDQILLEIQLQPDLPPQELLTNLRQQIEALPRPVVQYGPVAFSSRLLINEGCPDVDVSFTPPFESLVKSGVKRSRSLDDLLMSAAGLSAESMSWWGKLKQALGLSG